jgi:hypothetical protein
LFWRLTLIALKEEGIFRVSGSASQVERLAQSFAEGKPDIIYNKTSCHDVASLLKKFFRELPDPVIPFSFQDDFVAVIGIYFLLILLLNQFRNRRSATENQQISRVTS